MEGELLGVLVAAGQCSSSEPAGDERADGGVGAGDGEDGDAGCNGGCGDLASGVGDAGRARVADDGDARAGVESGDKLRGAAGLVVLVVADGGGTDLEVVEELLGLARVLASNFVYRAQYTQSAQGDVFEVADGRGDEIEAGGEGTAGGGEFAGLSAVILGVLDPCSSASVRGRGCDLSAADRAGRTRSLPGGGGGGSG